MIDVPFFAALKQNNKTVFQGNVSFRFCQRWSRAHSWFPGRVPQDGDNVTVEEGQLLLLDTSTSILNFVHVKGLCRLETGDDISTYNPITFRGKKGEEVFG